MKTGLKKPVDHVWNRLLIHSGSLPPKRGAQAEGAQRTEGAQRNQSLTLKQQNGTLGVRFLIWFPFDLSIFGVNFSEYEY